MTVNSLSYTETYLQAFDLFERNGSAQDPPWAHKLRKAAISRFNDLGFPTARRGNEEWKYTDVRSLATTPFQILPSSVPAKLTVQDLKRFDFGQSDWSRLVFVDGSYDESLSFLSPLPTGVKVSNLSEAMMSSGGLLEEHLGHHAEYEANAFTALNTAFIHDGAFVYIPDAIEVNEPILLLFLSTSRDQGTMSQPRVFLLTGKNSKVSIIESYETLSDNQYFTNSVTEIVIGAGSVVEYYKFQRQSHEAFHITNTHVVQARDSSFSSVNIDLGGGLVRNNLNLLMGDEGSACILNGLYMLTGSQHVDNQVIIDHAKPYTTSRELYKGILDGKSRSVFHGSIIVREGAIKVDARQEDKNLLLSDQAEADTKPAFWIYCDDVKCAHGAACGQLDEDALFYLTSRGISEQDARTLLTHGFVVEVIDSIINKPFRDHVEDLVQMKLHKWLGDEGRK